jgi:hypothetical protein
LILEVRGLESVMALEREKRLGSASVLVSRSVLEYPLVLA